jgi:hypothetical protein
MFASFEEGTPVEPEDGRFGLTIEVVMISRMEKAGAVAIAMELASVS